MTDMPDKIFAEMTVSESGNWSVSDRYYEHEYIRKDWLVKQINQMLKSYETLDPVYAAEVLHAVLNLLALVYDEK